MIASVNTNLHPAYTERLSWNETEPLRDRYKHDLWQALLHSMAGVQLSTQLMRPGTADKVGHRPTISVTDVSQNALEVYAGEPQGTDRRMDQRIVEDREQMLGHGLGVVQTRAASVSHQEKPSGEAIIWMQSSQAPGLRSKDKLYRINIFSRQYR